METLFEELKRYVEFSAPDEAALRELHPVVAPHFEAIAKRFYDRILDHAGARKALVEGESQVGKLKITLVAWMDVFFKGPWDERYYEQRARIGRVHVRIALPQHYMFGAMNVVRQEFNAVIDDHFRLDLPALRRARTATSKLLDLELAIMLHTYREDLLSQASRHERLATFGQLVGSIGHELRNPLGVIESSLFILDGRVGPDERARKHIGRIGEQLAIANGIVTSLLDMIRDRPLIPEPVRPAALVDAALAGVAVPPTVTVTVDGIAELPELRADAGQVRQVLVNLLENAVHAVAAGGEVWVRGRMHAGMVEIAVEDTGPGIGADVRARLFEPLVTTKAKGIGLGLALVKRIAERHRGTVAYEPRTGGGARFVVRLPVGAEGVDA